MHLDGVLSEFGGEVVADVADVLEDEDDGVDGVVGGAVVVVGVGEVLEEGQEAGYALGLQGYLRVVEVLGAGLGGGHRLVLVGLFRLLRLLHFPQLVHQLLYEGDVEALG